MNHLVRKRITHTFIIHNNLIHSEYEKALKCLYNLKQIFDSYEIVISKDEDKCSVYPNPKSIESKDLFDSVLHCINKNKISIDLNKVLERSILEDLSAKVSFNYADFKNGVISFSENTCSTEKGNYKFFHSIIYILGGAEIGNMFRHIYKIDNIESIYCNDYFNQIYPKYSLKLELRYIDPRLNIALKHAKPNFNNNDESMIIYISSYDSQSFIMDIERNITDKIDFNDEDDEDVYDSYPNKSIKDILKYIENAVYGYDVLLKPAYANDPAINAYTFNKMYFEEIN